MFTTIDLTNRVDLPIQLKNSIDEIKRFIFTTYADEDKDLVDRILSSPALTILDESMLELAKNSIDAGATTLRLDLEITNNEFITIRATDNGTGFPADKLGDYPIDPEQIGISSKVGSEGFLGGAHKGLLQASVALHRNGGKLTRENAHSGNGAVLVFTSAIKNCTFTICDYQIELDQNKRQLSGKPVFELKPIKIVRRF